jgi:ribonuclease G
VQIVRPRPCSSIPELVRADPVLTAVLGLLRTASRHVGACRFVACPAVIARIDARTDWREELERRIGGTVFLRADPALPISARHVEPAPS